MYNKQSKGFALILVLSIISLLGILIFSLSTMLIKHKKIANSSLLTKQAQQSAHLALNIALGELQESLGPDTSISGDFPSKFSDSEINLKNGSCAYIIFDEGLNPESDIDIKTLATNTSSGGIKKNLFEFFSQGAFFDANKPIIQEIETRWSTLQHYYKNSYNAALDPSPSATASYASSSNKVYDKSPTFPIITAANFGLAPYSPGVGKKGIAHLFLQVKLWNPYKKPLKKEQYTIGFKLGRHISLVLSGVPINNIPLTFLKDSFDPESDIIQNIKLDFLPGQEKTLIFVINDQQLGRELLSEAKSIQLEGFFEPKISLSINGNLCQECQLPFEQALNDSPVVSISNNAFLKIKPTKPLFSLKIIRDVSTKSSSLNNIRASKITKNLTASWSDNYGLKSQSMPPIFSPLNAQTLNSISQLRSVNLNLDEDAPTFQIGSSRKPLNCPSNAFNHGVEDYFGYVKYYYDYAYLLNQKLWDDFIIEANPKLLKHRFNINSTSESGWKKYLSFLAQKPFMLSETMITQLAKEIAAEVKTRGPFKSLAAFLNRELSSAPSIPSKPGVLQAALDRVGLNIDQSSLLDQLGGKISTRSDTFTIKAYGSAIDDKSNKAEALYEATIQRIPEFIKHSENHYLDEHNQLSKHNKKFGRRMKIIDLQQLH